MTRTPRLSGSTKAAPHCRLRWLRCPTAAPAMLPAASPLGEAAKVTRTAGRTVLESSRLDHLDSLAALALTKLDPVPALRSRIFLVFSHEPQSYRLRRNLPVAAGFWKKRAEITAVW